MCQDKLNGTRPHAHVAAEQAASDVVEPTPEAQLTYYERELAKLQAIIDTLSANNGQKYSVEYSSITVGNGSRAYP
jgi:hypothetical protein